MTTPEQSTPPRRATKFGGVEEQFNTIRGSKKPATESQEETSLMEIEVKTSESQKGKTSTDKEEKGQQTIRLPLSLRKWLRMQAPIEERDLSDIVTDALLDYKKKIGQ
jgi:hypothetical protein